MDSVMSLNVSILFYFSFNLLTSDDLDFEEYFRTMRGQMKLSSYRPNKTVHFGFISSLTSFVLEKHVLGVLQELIRLNGIRIES